MDGVIFFRLQDRCLSGLKRFKSNSPGRCKNLRVINSAILLYPSAVIEEIIHRAKGKYVNMLKGLSSKFLYSFSHKDLAHY
jgi:hypothetical protein